MQVGDLIRVHGYSAIGIVIVVNHLNRWAKIGWPLYGDTTWEDLDDDDYEVINASR